MPQNTDSILNLEITDEFKQAENLICAGKMVRADLLDAINQRLQQIFRLY